MGRTGMYRNATDRIGSQRPERNGLNQIGLDLKAMNRNILDHNGPDLKATERIGTNGNAKDRVGTQRTGTERNGSDQIGPESNEQNRSDRTTRQLHGMGWIGTARITTERN